MPHTARYAEEGPSPVARAGRAGGFLVGRRRPRFGAGGHLRTGGTARECLLPWVYWEHQVAHTRCTRRKAKIQRAWAEGRAAFDQHGITQRLAPHVLASGKRGPRSRSRLFSGPRQRWKAATVLLAQLHHNQRGLPTQRYKVWTVLHNFDCRAPDGTTPAARFFRRTFPDLKRCYLVLRLCPNRGGENTR